jgi:hypothetical protein
MLQWLLCLAYSGIFIYIIGRWKLFKIKELAVSYIIGAFILKLIIGIFLWQFYIRSYSANDASAFFNDSKVLYDSFFTNPLHFFKLLFGFGANDPSLLQYTSRMSVWNDDFNSFLINDSRTMIRFNAIVRFFSFGQYHVHTVFAGFISLTGLTLIYKSVIRLIPDKPIGLFVFLFLAPSVIFWSSAVFKESLVFAGIGIFLFHSDFGLRKEYSKMNFIGAITGLCLMLIMKYYVLFAMAPGIIANFWLSRTALKNVLVKYTTVVVFLFASLFIIPKLFPQYNFLENLKNKEANFDKMARGGVYLNAGDHYFIFVDYLQKDELLKFVSPGVYSLKDKVNYKKFRQNSTDTTELVGIDGTNFKVEVAIPPAGSSIYLKPVATDPVGFLLALPSAFINTLVLPKLFSEPYAWKLFSLLVNIGYLIFIAACLFFIRIKKEQAAYLLFLVSFIFILFSLIGLTTPVLGAIVRYRVPALPFLGILMLMLVDKEKIKKLVGKK